MSYSRSLAYMLLFYLIPQLSLARTLHGEHFWQKWVQQNGTWGHFPTDPRQKWLGRYRLWVYGKTKLAPATVPLSHQLLLVLHLAVADVEEDLMGEKPGSECQKILLSAAGAWPFQSSKEKASRKPQCGR